MKECVLSWTNVALCQVIMIIIDTGVTPPGARERRLGRTFDSVWSLVSTEAGTRTTSCGDQRPVAGAGGHVTSVNTTSRQPHRDIHSTDMIMCHQLRYLFVSK